MKKIFCAWDNTKFDNENDCILYEEGDKVKFIMYDATGKPTHNRSEICAVCLNNDCIDEARKAFREFIVEEKAWEGTVQYISTLEPYNGCWYVLCAYKDDDYFVPIPSSVMETISGWKIKDMEIVP